MIQSIFISKEYIYIFCESPFSLTIFKILHDCFQFASVAPGFGDSSGSPSEDGLIHDAKLVYRWIRKRSGGVPLFLWGHSMGSG